MPTGAMCDLEPVEGTQRAPGSRSRFYLNALLLVLFCPGKKFSIFQYLVVCPWAASESTLELLFRSLLSLFYFQEFAVAITGQLVVAIMFSIPEVVTFRTPSEVASPTMLYMRRPRVPFCDAV